MRHQQPAVRAHPALRLQHPDVPPRKLEGEPCGLDLGPCLYTFHCDDDVEGTCYALSAEGAACTPGMHPLCGNGLYCDSTTGLCAKRGILQVGEDCSIDAVECADGVCFGVPHCVEGAVCRPPDAFSGDGTCQPVRLEGEPCGEDGISGGPGPGPYVPPTPCRSPATCVDGTCQVVYRCCD